MLVLALLACLPTAESNKDGDTGSPFDDTAGDADSDSDTDSDSDSDADTDTDTDTDSDSDSDADTDTDTDTGPADTGEDTGHDTDTDTGQSSGAISVGDLFINEVMNNPNPVADEQGEWFELINTSGRDLDLDGLTISDEDATSPQSFTVSGRLLVPAGGFVILANNGDSSSNGGVTVDYAFDGTSFQLGNDSDEIVLSIDGVAIARLAYTEDWAGNAKGYSMTLDADKLTPGDADQETSWCNATSSFGSDGQFGTPGAANDDCGV
ncbi:MAG: lamin tail domain-containing protein [Deltaproteobacteria bacterium]|nr:lamin tail domain-containing protein [Deltaproteobacteria bacterium]